MIDSKESRSVIARLNRAVKTFRELHQRSAPDVVLQLAAANVINLKKKYIRLNTKKAA